MASPFANTQHFSFGFDKSPFFGHAQYLTARGVPLRGMCTLVFWGSNAGTMFPGILAHVTTSKH